MLTSISNWGGSRRQETHMPSSYPLPSPKTFKHKFLFQIDDIRRNTKHLKQYILGIRGISWIKIWSCSRKNSLWIEVPDWLVFKPPQQTKQITKHRNFTQRCWNVQKWVRGLNRIKKTYCTPYLKLSDISGRGNLRFNQAPNNSINSLHSPTKSPCSPICPREMINSR